MPGERTALTPDERSWHVPGPQAQRAFAVAVVTELAAVLEPVARDPFLDGVDERPLPARLTPRSKEWLPMLHQCERPRMRPRDALGGLVRAAAAGDAEALDRLVARFDRVLRAVARSYRLSRWDADDVVQATWLQFLVHGRALREPEAVSGWLVTTARRQSLRLLQRHVRELLSDDPARSEHAGGGEPDDELLASERRGLLHAALRELQDRQQHLMRVLMARPELSYEEVGRLLVHAGRQHRPDPCAGRWIACGAAARCARCRARPRSPAPPSALRTRAAARQPGSYGATPPSARAIGAA